MVDRLSAPVMTSPGDEKGDHNHDHLHPTPEPGRTAPRRNRPVPLVIGILLALVGFPLLLAGLGLGWAMATQRDDDGFFSTLTEQLTTETVALSSKVVNLGEAGPDDRWADRDLATVRLSAQSADASAVFIGIAPSADVARYLGSASYDEISELRTDPVRLLADPAWQRR